MSEASEGNPPLHAAALAGMHDTHMHDTQFRLLVEFAGQGIGWAGLDGSVVYMNPSLRQMLDLAPEEALGGYNMCSFFRPEDIGLLQGVILPVTLEKGRWTGEAALLSVKGRVTPTIRDIRLIRDNAGRPIAFACAITDLSQQKIHEQSFRDSKKKYRALLESIPYPMFYKDLQFRYQALNRHYANDLERTFQEIVGQDDYALHPTELADKYHRDDLRVIESGLTWECDEVYVRSGREDIIHTVKTPVKDERGAVIGVCGIFLDVTEQKRLQAQLRQERNFSGAVLDNAGALLLVLDREGRIHRFNRACETLSGYAFAEVEGRLLWEFLLLPEECDGVREHVLRALGSDAEALAEKYTNHWLDKAGGKHLLEWHKAPLLDDQGRLEYLVSIGIDITEKRKVEDALRRSEETYARAETITHIGAWDWDIAGGSLCWTDEIFRIFGHTPQSFGVTYAAFLAAIHPDDRQKVIAAVDASVADASVPYSVEHRVVRPDGTLRIVEERGQVYRDEQGTPVRMIGSVHDITERKRVELELEAHRSHLEELVRERTAELEKQNQRNAMIVNTTLDGFFSAGMDGRVLDCNEIYCRMLGYSREEMLRLRIPDIESIESPEEIAAHTLKILDLGYDRFDTLHRCKDGSCIHVEVSVTLAPIGEENYFFAFVHDISERKAAEKALRFNQAMLMRTEGIAHIGSWDWDVATDTVTWSDAMFHLFQRNPLEGAPSLAQHAALYDPEDMPLLVDAVAAAVNHGTPYALELRTLSKNGAARVCLARGYAEMGAGNRAVRLFGSLQDITERKQTETEILRTRDEAERANYAKSEFLSRMSHELRTPLNAILGFGQLLQRDKLPAEQADNVQEVLHAGRHLLELINEVLDLARIESGKFTVSLEPVALHALIAECLALMRPQAEARGIRIGEVGPDCDQHVQADRTRLKQVLLNLLSNAVKFNHERGTVGLACVVDGDAIQIRISDSGAGLSAEQQARLFVAFERLDADKRAIEGTGIGLALSKRLVELMQGEIGVESTPGEGSTFWLSLPRADGPADSAQPVAGQSETASERAAAAGRRPLLCIEDNPANLRLIERILARRPDIHLLTASAPGLGLELAQTYLPALILLDINLPDMDGYEVLRRLQANAATRAIPVIGISANAMPQDLERARAAGFVDYLTKPLDIGKLLRTIEATLVAHPRS